MAQIDTINQRLQTCNSGVSTIRDRIESTASNNGVSIVGGTDTPASLMTKISTAFGTARSNVAKPIDISTAADMDALLVAENVGKAYRYTGTSTSSYTNGDIYVVEADS